MIEKTIHYIWLGNRELPQEYAGYIEGWKKLHPDWEIKKWTEENFDCNCNSWIKTALEQKRWSLASDVMRIIILINYGGVYLDSDMQLLKPLDKLVEENDFFIGYETNLWFGTAILAAKKGHKVMQEALKRYLVPCPQPISRPNMQTVLNFSAVVKRLYNVKLYNKTTKIGDNGTLYAMEFFFPKNYITRKGKTTENTIGIHHYQSAWFSNGDRFGIRVARTVLYIFGQFLFTNLFERLARLNMLGKLSREYKRNLKNQKNSGQGNVVS